MAATGALAAGGAVGYRTMLGTGTPAPGLKVLTPTEESTVAAIGQVYFPGTDGLPSATDVGAVRFVDTYVAEFPPHLRRLMRLAIRSIEWGAVFVAGEGSRFTKCSLPARTAMLDAWESSSSYLRHATVFSVKWALSLGYFEKDEVREDIGWNTVCPTLPRGSVQEWL